MNDRGVLHMKAGLFYWRVSLLMGVRHSLAALPNTLLPTNGLDPPPAWHELRLRLKA